MLKFVGMLMLMTGAVWAQETEDYRTIIYGKSFGSTSKVILNQEEIRNSKAPNVSTLLATLANVSVVSTSFQPGALYMRGGDSSHLLILVDGLPFYDPSTLNKTVNLNQIDIKSIRRIEISKGAQTVLYGGQALVGVIKIETFPKDIRNQNQAVVEGGERDYRKMSLTSVRDLNDNRAVVGRLQWSEKNNRSPVLQSDAKYPSETWSGDLGYMKSGHHDYYFKASVLSDEADVSSSRYTDFRAVDATDFNTSSKVHSVLAGWREKELSFKPQILFGFQRSDKRYQYMANPLSAGGPEDDKFGSDLLNIRMEAIPLDQESAQVVAGVSYSKESLVQRDLSDTETANEFAEAKGVFVKADFDFNSDLSGEIGLRQDEILKEKQVQSFQTGFVYRKNLKVEYATGYKTPSLSQLFGYGANPDLQPERSRTLTVDYSHSLSESQKISVTLFQSLFDNLIVYQTQPPPQPGQNVNIAKADTKGLELQYEVSFPSQTAMRLNLGYQEPWDVQNARWLTRRPLQTGSVSLNQIWEKNRFHYEVLWNGERLDRFSLSSYGNLEAYVISNAAWTYEHSSSLSLYVRGNNIGNHRYEESRGYFNEGSFWLIGMEIAN